MKIKSFAFALVFSLFFFLPQSASADTCEELEVPVRLAPGLPANKIAAGTFCEPSSYGSGEKEIDILVHGGTYNRLYWDFPTNYPQYSYVKRTLDENRATFAYDRLGTGESSTPSSALVDIDADAYIMHQIIQYLRGAPNNFERVNAIGHSFGSIVAINEDAAYQDIDRLVVTGLLHAAGLDQLLSLTYTYPAMLDPQFAGLLDPGYITTRPGVRGGFFYNETADPAVISYDEAHKDKVSGVQAADGLSGNNLPAPVNVSQGVIAPMLVVVGDEDDLVCGLALTCTEANVLANEAPYYTNAASLDVAVIFNTGHDLALHPSADDSFEIINDWIISH